MGPKDDATLVSMRCGVQALKNHFIGIQVLIGHKQYEKHMQILRDIDRALSDLAEARRQARRRISDAKRQLKFEGEPVPRPCAVVPLGGGVVPLRGSDAAHAAEKGRCVTGRLFPSV